MAYRRYLIPNICCAMTPSSNNELAQVIYQAMESYHNPWQYSPMSAPEGDDSLLIERDIE